MRRDHLRNPEIILEHCMVIWGKIKVFVLCKKSQLSSNVTMSSRPLTLRLYVPEVAYQITLKAGFVGEQYQILLRS